MRRNQETTSQPEKQRRQVSRGMKLLAGGAALLAAGCSTTPKTVQGNGNKADDSESARMAVYYADNLEMEDSDAMQARIDDPTVAAESRLAVDGEEKDWATYYQNNGNQQAATDMAARVGK